MNRTYQVTGPRKYLIAKFGNQSKTQCRKFRLHSVFFYKKKLTHYKNPTTTTVSRGMPPRAHSFCNTGNACYANTAANLLNESDEFVTAVLQLQLQLLFVFFLLIKNPSNNANPKKKKKTRPSASVTCNLQRVLAAMRMNIKLIDTTPYVFGAVQCYLFFFKKQSFFINWFFLCLHALE